MSDPIQPITVRKLITSQIIDLAEDTNIELQKDAEPPDKAYLATRYKLKLRALKLSRQSYSPPQADEGKWQFEGIDWQKSEDGWQELQDPIDSDDDADRERSYSTYATQTDVCLHACVAPPASSLPDVNYFRIQCDHGANASITSNRAALENIKWIQPTSVASADKDSSLLVSGIGQLPILVNGIVFKVNCYYSERSDGTLLSPNAFARQFNDIYFGYKIFSNLDKSLGETVFLGRDGVEDLVMTTSMDNLLWFLTPDHHPLCKPLLSDTAPVCKKFEAHDPEVNLRVNRLSDAASWELWHQRLGHSGTSVLETIHDHAEGVPRLHGNAFYKCPSCMPGKLCTKQPSKRKGNLGSTISNPPKPATSTPVDIPHFESAAVEDELDAWLDEIHLPDAEPGQHFHIDFGFARGSEFSLKLASGRTITSIDGKNAYLLIADRKTRMLWIYVCNTKTPPVDQVKMILNKFGSKNTHRTVRTDQDKALGKSVQFAKMVEEAGFIVELTGSDNSKQNSLVERPHRDLAQMMRCMLHSSGLGPEYWSHAIVQAVFIKNRVPHRSLGMSPYQAFTGKKPNLSNLRIFGSRVYARKPGLRPAKLDHNTSSGIFLSHTSTSGNVNFIDDKSGLIKMGTHILFDEAHMTVPANKAPLAAQALQRLGYYAREQWIDTSVKQEFAADRDRHILIERLTKTSIPPTRSTPDSVGLDLHSDMDEFELLPGDLKVVTTGIAAKAPSGTYLRVAPRSGLTIKSNINTLAGVIDPDYTGNVGVVLHNFGTTPKLFKRGDRIAQLIPEKIDMPEIAVVDKLGTTARGTDGFGSTEGKQASKKYAPAPPILPPPSCSPEIPIAAAAAKTALPPDIDPVIKRCEDDLHYAFDMPYDITLSSCPFDNFTSRTLSTWGSDDLLGLAIKMDESVGLPQLKSIDKSTPAARIKKWKSELRGSYITSINGTTVTSIEEIRTAIAPFYRDKDNPDITVTFATIEKLAMNPQLGLPQLYHDQMNIIGKHLWEIQNDAAWSEQVDNAIPILESQSKNACVLTKEDRKSLIQAGFPVRIQAVKAQKKLTRRFLKKQTDWSDWQQSEWKQLDAYRDQDMFEDPEPKPRGVNLLSLLWCYLIKDCGRKKARCVCNGSKNMRGTVTLAETYAASLDQTASRLFWAASAINNFITIGADAANAFAEAPPPVAPLYVYVDAQYREWHKARNPDAPPIPQSHVMRAKRALQGHPESPRLWAQLIDKIIRKLNLKPCTHEPNLYYTSNYKDNTGKRVLFLRQVDDFAISCEDEALCEEVIEDINSEMTIQITKLGKISRFNGVDVEQARHYVKLYNTTYIRKILKNHDWLQNELPMSAFPLPMRSDSAYAKCLETATPLTPDERDQMEKDYGFTYRQGIGEILYALVTCRPDISYATIKLSQYSTRPAKIHFDALKEVYKYLQATEADGIYYWRTSPRMDLPIGTMPICKNDDNYDDTDIHTRQQHSESILHAAVDSDFAGDTTHRKSVTGIVIKLAGGAVLYKTAYQPTIAGSSTEAEFAAAAAAAKHILHLRTLLEEIGLRQEAATILFEDNQGALLMANAQRPTKRTRHMDIRYFTIQQWVAEDLLCLKRIDTDDNYSDSMTKALGRTLFYRHMNFVMGRKIPEFLRATLSLRIQRLSDRSFDNILSRESVKRIPLIPIL